MIDPPNGTNKKTWKGATDQARMSRLNTMVKVMNIPDFANELLRSNICAVPCSMPDKRPALETWTKYQKKFPSIGEHQFNGALGIITGKISGDVFVLDIDTKYDITGTLVERLQEEIGDDLYERIFQAAYIQKTVNNGLHIFLRCEQIEGNLKLARRYATAEEKEVNPDEKVKVLLETRGEGGFIVVAPTPGYEAMSGSLQEIGFISIDDKERLFECCRSFNEVFDEVQPPTSKRFISTLSGNVPPWEDYNQRADIPSYLQSQGWTYFKKVGKNLHFSRPGKKGSTSGTYHEDLNLFRCFTTSCPLDSDKSYSPAALFTYLECNGNFEESARQLRAMGYGSNELRQNSDKALGTSLGTLPTKVEVQTLPPREVLRMTYKYVRQNLDPAIVFNGVTLIYPGELFALVGLPGQGKSAVMEAIATAHLSGSEVFGFQVNAQGKKVLCIDTERPPDNVSTSYGNIGRRLGKPKLDDKGEIDGLVYLTVADIGQVQQLKAILEREISTKEFSLVLLDGILDFSKSMNDDLDATEVVKWVRALAVKYNCGIAITIHPNKGSEVIAGHLGAFLYRWCRAILFVRPVKDDKSIKEITGGSDMAKLSHGDVATLTPVHIAWDENYRMLMRTDYTPKEDRGKAEKMRNALEVVFADDKRYRHGELVAAIAQMGHSQSTAKRWIKEGIEQNLIDNSMGIYKGSGSGS